jgi:hypothetical protein
MEKMLAAAVAGILSLLALADASATIVSGAVTGGTAQTAGGAFVKLTPPLSNPFGPPNTVGLDTFQSPNLYGFDELQNVTLAGPLSVDVGISPIAAGTIVSSHYILFDPGPLQHVVGTVDFDADVVGILTSVSDLGASDFLADPQVTYLNPGGRGLSVGDSVTISGARQIRFDTTASSPGDYVRVLTSATPEPDTDELLILAFGGLAAFVRRRGR